MSEKEETTSTNSFSDEEQRAATESYNAFTQGQYDACITTLKKIQKNHPGDCKLMHNRFIAEFYKSGQTKTGDLKKNLTKVQKVTQQSHQDDDDLSEETTSAEYSVLNFNQSVLYYNLHQYVEAKALLEPLVENPEISHNMREICLLLAEIYLITYEPEKASQLIGKIEEIFAKPSSPQQSKNSSSGESKDKGKTQKSNAVGAKEIKYSLPLLKTRCSLQLKSMKACKRELKAFTSLEGTADLPSATIQILSVFLKSNFEFQRGNFHKAYKLLGSTPPTQSVNNSWLFNGECLMTMFYNNLGVIHFCMSKHSLGTFYLMKALEENDVSINTLTKKPEGKHQQQGTSSNVKTLQMLNMNKKFEILYNTGIQLLFAGKPAAAFDCLIVAAQVFYLNPRLWLRLAECCIQATCSPDNTEETHGSQAGRAKTAAGSPNYAIIGSGIHQKLVIHPLSRHSNGNGNSVMPGPTLEFASVCLHNALTILAEAGVTSRENKEKSDSKTDATNKKSDVSVPCFPAPPVSGQELNSLHASILCNSAFVALSLGNNLMAYEYSKSLLHLPNLTGRQRYLGQMYCAEALVSLDRIADAIQQLSGTTISDIGDSSDAPQNSSKNSSQSAEDAANQPVGKPVGPRSTQTCFRSAQHAKACMLLNLASAHSLRSEFEKAQKILSSFASLVPHQDVPANAILLSVYINLHMSGGLPAALKVLQHNSLIPHTTSTINSQAFARTHQQQNANSNSASGLKTIPGSAGNISHGAGSEISSNGSMSGGSSGSRSKSSTPQPPYSGPPSGSVTPERLVKAPQPGAKQEGSSKTKRGRR